MATTLTRFHVDVWYETSMGYKESNTMYLPLGFVVKLDASRYVCLLASALLTEYGYLQQQCYSSSHCVYPSNQSELMNSKLSNYGN